MTEEEQSLQMETPWAAPAERVLHRLGVKEQEGLDRRSVRERRKKHGRNVLQQTQPRSGWQILIDQFKSLVILLLAVAAVLSFAFQQHVEGIAISVAILINTLIGFFTERKAVQSMEALRQMTRVKTTVRRKGKARAIPAEELVVGDVVLLEGGDIVTADLRLIEANRLESDESPLTGESVPVAKSVEAVDPQAPLAERTSMCYKGTSVTQGSGKGVVTAVGMNTELGHVSSLMHEAEDEETPLEKRLDLLGRSLIGLTIILAVIVAVLGILQGKSLILMVESAIALAVAAIPEGLPIVATIALARGMMRMAKKNAVVNRLASVETLGTTNILCTDKTGTLTENRMTLEIIQTEAGDWGPGADEPVSLENESIRLALRIGVLCNNASIDDSEHSEGGTGDPLERALLRAGEEADISRGDLLHAMPEEREEAFDPEKKLMATVHASNSEYEVMVKGAPEAVLEVCSQLRGPHGTGALTDDCKAHWLERNEELAGRGLRVLGLATKSVDAVEEQPYENLTWVGLVGLLDPPRETVADDIALCRHAGIKVIMVTGDQAPTALYIADRIDLAGKEELYVKRGADVATLDSLSQSERHTYLRCPVYARVSPEQKLNLIALHQENDSIVAMTGDGVNDAPALKKADIGVAMGRRGTQVAREAADVVLEDDAFSTITLAIEQGRVIFNHIRKFILYLLSGNIAEILVVGAASVIGWPLPLLPLQILFLNVILDVFPALALGLGKGEGDEMDRPPRPLGEPVITRAHWVFIIMYGVLIAATVLVGFRVAMIRLAVEGRALVTVSFLTLALARLWHVFNMRSSGTHPWRNEIVRNPLIWGALLICWAGLAMVSVVPALSAVLKIAWPGIAGFGLALGMSFVPLLVGQLLKAFNLDRLR